MPKLLFVAAHPDDDTFGIARTVALHSENPEFRFLVIHATDGEAGEIAPDSGVSRQQLATARRREATESWEAVGQMPYRHDWLGLPDGGLAESPHEVLVDQIWSVMAEERPDVVATFGPDGVTAHPDHVTIGAATTEAFGRLAGDGGPGLKRLLFAAIRQSWVDRWNHNLAEAGLSLWDPKEPYHIRGVPDETIGVDVDAEAVVERVLAGIRRHKTQWSYQMMGDDYALARSLRREHFVIAWPPRSPGDPVLGDVFEGL